MPTDNGDQRPQVGLVRQIGDELGKIFRHMLPGLGVLGAAAASHPSWFGYKPGAPPGTLAVDLGNPWHLVVLAAVALLAGNVWYVLHRYTVHQLLDFVLYCIYERRWRGYSSWLANHIDRSFCFRRRERDLHTHVTFRSAQIIFMLVAAEIAFVFSIDPEVDTFFMAHGRWIKVGSIAILAVGPIVFWLSHSLDLELVKRSGDADTTRGCASS